jgi:hypothetical protein
MNVWVHPYLAALWVILIAFEFRLVAHCPQVSVVWETYIVLVPIRGVWLLLMSFLGWPEGYYRVFWLGQWIFHVIVLIMVLSYALRCARSGLRLPKSFQWTAVLVTMTLLGTATLLRWHESNPDGSAMLSAEQYVQLWMCGTLWFCYLCNALLCEHDLTHDLMQGFLILYSVYLPVTRETLWLIDMFSRLGVVLWWTEKVKRFAVKERV